MTARIFEGYYLTSDGRITRFDSGELGCRCGCGLVEMLEPTIDAIHAARTELNRPIIPTSGRRCFTHNAAIGGEDDSAHLPGWAIDSQSTIDLYAFYLMLNKHFRRVCVYSRAAGEFCHADMRLDGPTIWDVVNCDGKFLWTDFLAKYMIPQTRDSINEVLEAT